MPLGTSIDRPKLKGENIKKDLYPFEKGVRPRGPGREVMRSQRVIDGKLPVMRLPNGIIEIPKATDYDEED